ncbi:hypothetical protein EXE43_23250 [Halorubrum sp. SS5]|nr:hypothetical protein EXE43_23250 [Halorubrum sp. SS5]
MERRGFAAGVIAVASGIVAGCAGERGLRPRDGGWDPTITADEVTVSPGGEATLAVRATDVGGFTFRPPPEGIRIETSAPEADIVPSPDSGADSYPPQWFWPSRTNVSVEVPISVDDAVEPGEYQYGVAVSLGEESDRTVREEFPLTVADG